MPRPPSTPTTLWPTRPSNSIDRAQTGHDTVSGHGYAVEEDPVSAPQQAIPDQQTEKPTVRSAPKKRSQEQDDEQHEDERNAPRQPRSMAPGHERAFWMREEANTPSHDHHRRE